MKFTIALVPGDGIGPDVVAQATQALEAVGRKFGHVFAFQPLLAGGVLAVTAP